MPVAGKVLELVYNTNDPICIFLGRCSCGETAEIGGQRLVPIHPRLPGASFVRNKDDIVVPFVNVM